MTNIVMIARNRPRLTAQCLRTLYNNTDEAQFNLVIVDDGSFLETQKLIDDYDIEEDNCVAVRFMSPIGILGFLRNVGAWTSERYFGRGDYVCFLDNDVAVLDTKVPWLSRMEEATRGLAVVGGCRHPYHGVNLSWAGIEATDAVAGYSLLMKWQMWDEIGPFDQHARGTGQSEDYALCRKAIGDGSRIVGYVHPPVLAHCGITNSDGKPATGAESFPRVNGLIYE